MTDEARSTGSRRALMIGIAVAVGVIAGIAVATALWGTGAPKRTGGGATGGAIAGVIAALAAARRRRSSGSTR